MQYHLLNASHIHISCMIRLDQKSSSTHRTLLLAHTSASEHGRGDSGVLCSSGACSTPVALASFFLVSLLFLAALLSLLCSPRNQSIQPSIRPFRNRPRLAAGSIPAPTLPFAGREAAAVGDAWRAPHPCAASPTSAPPGWGGMRQL